MSNLGFQQLGNIFLYPLYMVCSNFCTLLPLFPHKSARSQLYMQLQSWLHRIVICGEHAAPIFSCIFEFPPELGFMIFIPRRPIVLRPYSQVPKFQTSCFLTYVWYTFLILQLAVLILMELFKQA